MIKIYYVEDSPTAVHVMRRLLASASDVALVGVARDGAEAKVDIPRLRPDVVITDLVMPLVDGHELITWLMANHPLPILVLSDLTTSRASAAAFRAIDAGALDVSYKPRAGASLAADAEALLRRLRMLSGVRVVRRRPSLSTPAPIERRAVHVIGIGSSTGGPGALLRVLQPLPPHFALPVLVVQHIGAEFLPSLIGWLADSISLPVQVAADGEVPRGGTVYFAPSSAHLELAPTGRLRLVVVAPVRGHRPSVDVLFQSLASVAGDRACGVLLTGMGVDGAEGLDDIRRAGGLTLAQDEASCAVFGMPRAAILRGAASRVLGPEQIGGAIAAMQPKESLSP